MLEMACWVAFAWAAIHVLQMRRVAVHRVVDGDSIELAGSVIERIRIKFIDAPEYHSQAHGKAARTALANLLAGRSIRIVRRGRDRYGRTLASVYAGRTPVAIWMTWQGHAWPSDSLMLTLISAWPRVARRGLWRNGIAVRPSHWRAASR